MHDREDAAQDADWMGQAQVLMWAGAGTALGVAVLAGWRERMRKQRTDPDAVGLVSWPTVQMLALIATAICAALAFAA